LVDRSPRLKASICPEAEPKLTNKPSERGRKGRFAHAVIDDIAEASLGNRFHARGKILFAVEDRVLGASLLGELGFFG
jgi:hypothetical protein